MLNFLHPSSLAARATACSTDAGDTWASSHTASMTLAVAAPGGRAVKTRPATAVPPPPPPPPPPSPRRNSHFQLGIVSPPRPRADQSPPRSPSPLTLRSQQQPLPVGNRLAPEARGVQVQRAFPPEPGARPERSQRGGDACVSPTTYALHRQRLRSRLDPKESEIQGLERQDEAGQGADLCEAQRPNEREAGWRRIGVGEVEAPRGAQFRQRPPTQLHRRPKVPVRGFEHFVDQQRGSRHSGRVAEHAG